MVFGWFFDGLRCFWIVVVFGVVFLFKIFSLLCILLIFLLVMCLFYVFNSLLCF